MTDEQITDLAEPFWLKDAQKDGEFFDANGFARALLSASKPAAPAHEDDLAVDRFAVAMKEKLALARAKGRGGWEECSPFILSEMLRRHVEKGDPVDVANFCAFLWNLDWPIAEPAAPAQSGKPWAYLTRTFDDNGHSIAKVFLNFGEADTFCYFYANGIERRKCGSVQPLYAAPIDGGYLNACDDCADVIRSLSTGDKHE